ncbi:GNAT family N-acetyltransferase [Streptomyces sp. NPDC049954]|uniref:GNAT family N-acetyltransferase n=1 Tax=Streptomyces sp. NPDC049954 TaxID=3155779 RepID=UPI0034136464
MPAAEASSRTPATDPTAPHPSPRPDEDIAGGDCRNGGGGPPPDNPSHPAGAAPAGPGAVPGARGVGLPDRPLGADLLDSVASWGGVDTAHGFFRLVPVRLPRDLRLLSGWMNEPEVAAFWELAGPPSVTEAHVRPQLEGDGRSVPCVGELDGSPLSYWEIYRADLDVLTPYYAARPEDTGVHLLIGGAAHRGRGLGPVLLRAVADLIFDHRPTCTRVVAEPDVRNARSVAAFARAGFRRTAELNLPDKRAALMIRDRQPHPPPH